MNLENNLYGLIRDIIQGVATLFMFLILIRSLMTWLKQEVIARFYGFFSAVAKITDPFLNFIRKVFPSYIGRVDLSPLIALFLVEIIKYLLLYAVKMIYKL
jgi:YggT family protein